MTYNRYRLILLCFLVAFVGLAGTRYFIKGFDLSTLISIYAIALLYWLLLFFFLLYAGKKGITDNNTKIAPAKILPILVAWIVFISVLYPLTMAGTYKAMDKVVHRTISTEDLLIRTKKAATDISKTPDQRRKAAQYYFKYSGQGIIYSDEHEKNKEYIPDDSARQARLNYLETLKEQHNLYSFMIVSAALSLLSGGAVASIYFRTRKHYKQETFT